MKKTLILLTLLSILIGCQREKANEVGVGYNKSLIIPPTNDLPSPGSTQEVIQSDQNSNPLVDSILTQTEANQVNPSIIDQIFTIWRNYFESFHCGHLLMYSSAKSASLILA